MDSLRRTHPSCVTLALTPFQAGNVTTTNVQFGGFHAGAEAENVRAGRGMVVGLVKRSALQNTLTLSMLKGLTSAWLVAERWGGGAAP